MRLSIADALFDARVKGVSIAPAAIACLLAGCVVGPNFERPAPPADAAREVGADLLVLLGIPYQDPRALDLARRVMGFIQETSKKASRDLAESRGAFPNFPGSVYGRRGEPPLRNATTTTIAPTGTISLIADCSNGIEPYFALAYQRLILGTRMTEVNRFFLETARRQGFDSEELRGRVEATGTLRGAPGVPAAVKRLFRTALEIPPAVHIEMQAAFQEQTDNAVSKTINLPHRASKEDVAQAYLLAYRKGCKGITVFRYDARRGTLVRFSDVD